VPCVVSIIVLSEKIFAYSMQRGIGFIGKYEKSITSKEATV
jgi:hypothetical protein